MQESAQTKAGRLIAEAASDGVTERNLLTWRKGHPTKIRLAMKLRAETTVTVAWIARRLSMGTREHLAHVLWEAKTPSTASRQPTLGI